MAHLPRKYFSPDISQKAELRMSDIVQAVGDLVVGTVLAPGSTRAIECRIAMILAGFPNTVPIKTVNR